MSNLRYSLDASKFKTMVEAENDSIMKEDKKSSEDENSNPSSNSDEKKLKSVNFSFAESIANQMGNF